MLLTKEEVLQRLCELCTYVRDELDHDYLRASDCFCGENKFAQIGDYRMETSIIDFIVDATKAKVKEEKAKL